jgi:hypothetical protein
MRATSSSVLKNMSYVLNVKDVISDAHNTFMRGVEEQDADGDEQYQRELEDMVKRDRAFNWSDDEENTVAAQNTKEQIAHREKVKLITTVKAKTPKKSVSHTRSSLVGVGKSTTTTTGSSLNRHSMPAPQQQMYH